MPFYSDAGTYVDLGFAWHENDGLHWTALWNSGGSPQSMNTSDGRRPTNQWVARRWRSAVAGSLTLIGYVGKTFTGGGDGVTGRVLVDGIEAYCPSISSNDQIGVSFSVVTNVSVNSTIDLAIDPNLNDANDATTFIGVILAPPAPPAALKVIPTLAT